MRKQDMLLLLIAVSGEMPADLAEQIIGSVSCTASVITRLKQEGYISVRNKAGWKGYVLRAKGKRYVLSQYGEDTAFFLQGSVETNHVKTEIEKRLEKLGVVRRVFRTLDVKGQTVSNVLFLDLNVTVLEHLTYPKEAETGTPEARGRCPPDTVSPKSGRGVTEISERVSPEFVGGGTKTSETYTESTAKDYRTKDFYQSYQYVEDMVKAQIDYEALKNDNPYDERIDELLGIMVEVLTSSSKTIRVNREEKPAQVVKEQFQKITKNHIEFVLHSMDESHTKARNIRALLVTALYNSIHTISTYYGNLVQYHMATDIYTAKEVEE